MYSDGNGRRCFGKVVIDLATSCRYQYSRMHVRMSETYHRRAEITPRPCYRPSPSLRALDKLRDRIVVIAMSNELLDQYGDAAQFSQH